MSGPPRSDPPSAEDRLRALQAAVSLCMDDRGVTDLGTIKRAWFYAATGRDVPCGSLKWPELREMARSADSQAG